MQKLLPWLLNSKKAIYGGVAAAIAWFVAKNGWTLDTTLGEVVDTLPSGLVTAVIVWWTSNKPK